jgi:hypothetical protein
MHILGKLLAVCVLICAVTAAVFTSKLVQVRNSWTSKATGFKKRYSKDLQPNLEKLEAEVELRKNELIRSQDLWGRALNGVQTNLANAADGSLNINVGSELEIHPGLVLHGFEVAEDGKSTYRGSFLVTDAANGNTTLKPNWRVKADDVKKWQPGVWRWRTSIPSGHQENIDKQLLTIVKYEETLADRRRTLAAQKVLLEQANDSLKLREAELIGGDMLAKSASVDPEFRDGLVSAVEQTEETRNQKLQQIDELRRKVREVQADIERLLAENQDLVRKLPAPTADNKLTLKKK